MLPVNFLRHTSKYNLDINGVKITAEVIEITGELIEADVSELRSRLDIRFPIVGFDLKYTIFPENPDFYTVILVLYVQGYCLLVKFDAQESSLSDSLTILLKDQSICFLGCGDFFLDKVDLVRDASDDYALETCDNVSTLAARVLKSKEILEQECWNLEDLATKVGVTFSGNKFVKKVFKLDEDPLFYTEEEVKYAIEDAFKCYTIGTSLMKLNS